MQIAQATFSGSGEFPVATVETADLGRKWSVCDAAYDSAILLEDGHAAVPSVKHQAGDVLLGHVWQLLAEDVLQRSQPAARNVLWVAHQHPEISNSRLYCNFLYPILQSRASVVKTPRLPCSSGLPCSLWLATASHKSDYNGKTVGRKLRLFGGHSCWLHCLKTVHHKIIQSE